jgi:simple sugar transport system permease protein
MRTAAGLEGGLIGAPAARPRLAGVRPFVRAVVAVSVALAVTAVFILLSGRNPLTAYALMVQGAFGSWDRVIVGLNKTTPYLLAGAGIALCFRANVINIGAEGQIALGGLAAAWAALEFAALPGFALLPAALAAGAVAGALWSALAAAIRLSRGVHEVLCTLLLNFVALLVVAEALHGELGEPGAGYPQSPLFEPHAWLPKLVPGTDLHIGFAIAVLAVFACRFLLWRTPTGFRWRLVGASPNAARYAGVSIPRSFMGVMVLAGLLAGIAGAVETLGVHYRLIEGFANGFGFNAVAIALMGAANPLGVLPAALFFGFLEAGALAMQRQIGVPSSLVLVIQGLTIILVLVGMGQRARMQQA